MVLERQYKTERYLGECCDNKLCNDQFETICDQYGQIYESKCHFENKRCENKKR